MYLLFVEQNWNKVVIETEEDTCNLNCQITRKGFWYDILSTSKNSCFDHATLIRKRNGYQAKVQLNECIEGNIRHLWKLMMIRDGLAFYDDANFHKKAIPFLLFDLDQIDAEQSNQCMSAKLLLAEIGMPTLKAQTTKDWSICNS